MSYEEIPPDVIVPNDSHALPQALKSIDTVIALYDYQGPLVSHLHLDLGDTVYVLNKSDSGWWDGVTVNRGEVTRGWFPHNYVRSVNYVQPVLNKLKTNKEIDSITAANTAANVLIPSFTTLLQKSLLESGRSASGSSPRKNSVVSFASLDSTPGNSSSNAPNTTNAAAVSNTGSNSAPGSPSLNPPAHPAASLAAAHHPSLVSTASSAASGPSENKLVSFISVEDAERLSLEIKSTEGKNLVWVPRQTSDGGIAFYSEQLEAYCESLPLVPFITRVDMAPGGNLDLPSAETALDNVLVTRHPSLDGGAGFFGDSSHHRDSHDSANFNANKDFDQKRDSNASSMSHSSSVSSYHHFSQPFFALPDFFYTQSTDIAKWTDLRDSFLFLLDLTYKALKDYNKQLFCVHLSQLTKVVTVVFACARLVQDDFFGSQYELSVKAKLRRLSAAFSQMCINGLLHLSVMHHSNISSHDGLFSLNIRDLNKSTSGSPYPGSGTASGTASGVASGAASGSPSATASPASSRHPSTAGMAKGRLAVPSDDPAQNRPSSPRLLDLSENSVMSYMQQIHVEMDVVRTNMTGLIDMFINFTKDKRVSFKDYDSSDTSEGEGEDRFNLLPQVYPRFITDEFNGGNWCNPFFTETRPFLNLGGEHLKNKHHLKSIIDSAAYDRMKQLSNDIAKVSRDTLAFIDPASQLKYYNEALLNERNEQVLRLIYKYLHHGSAMVDLLESLDFTVFCLIKRYSVADGTSHLEKPASHLRLDPNNNLAFDYPVVLDFFLHKQHFHTLMAKVVMYTQSITLEDPDVFVAMKDEDLVLYNRETMKDPLQKAAAVLSNLLVEQNNMKDPDDIILDQEKVLAELLVEGTQTCEHMLAVTQQLVDERETILNYATRVMHDDFNVELLVVERNNTVAGDHGDDAGGSGSGGGGGSGGQYYSDKLKDSNVPWFLQGDEEYDLLLDMKGNIKGGTKEALVAHLTHHSNANEAFTRAFLVSFATIMSIGELVQLLIDRFNMEAPEGLSYEEYLTWKTEHQKKVRGKVLDVMRQLVERYWLHAYFSAVVLQRWLAFTELPAVKPYAAAGVLHEELGRLMAGETLVETPEPELVPGKPPAPLLKGFSLKKMKLHDIDYVELARQITIREFALFRKIDKLACIHKVWGKKSGVDVSVGDITNFIKTSNQLTFFVSYMILRKDDTRKRVRIIRYFVQVADKCRQFRNFSSMTAIISALYLSPIHRLTKTWALVSHETLAQLHAMNKLMNSSRNFNEYRDMLHFIDHEPCVPFFGVYLSDLTFVFHGNPQYLLNRNRMINFAKRAKTVEIVEGIDRFQQMGYNYQVVPEIQKFLDLWLERCPSIEEQYQLSLQLEPKPQADAEKSDKSSRSRQTPLNVLGMK